ncbi:uncharacterized protein CTRU02_209153 [Colletotrichum truncatum]|uniref:Uncharacterized protein n=1 Tax=Colletotrichum truncatum TaxID=5467 RepID=A0ACC3YYN6_COLTU
MASRQYHSSSQPQGKAKTSTVRQAPARGAATAAVAHQPQFVMPDPISIPVSISAKKPQLNLPEQAYKPEYYEAISAIMQLRDKYIEDRVLFVPGREMARLLKQLGARDEDFEALQNVSDNLVGDPTLPYRKTRNGRFCLDFDAGTLRRLEFQPFILSKAEDFSRYDSDKVRHFDEVEDELQLNSVFQALMIFKSAIYHGVQSFRRPNMDYDTNKWICTLFSVRTTTTPERLGEPALEGVHTDGVDHTMTTFLGSQNMKPESAVTYVHDMRETTGIRYTDASPDYINGRVHHRHFLDTMMVVDSERKHSLSPVYAIEPNKPATRDMLVFFSRKPTVAGHVSADLDSMSPHLEMPMEIPVFVPFPPHLRGGTEGREN